MHEVSHGERTLADLDVARSVLAITDFSECGDKALARAALLSAEHGAALRLVHLASSQETAPLDASQRLAHHARQLGQRHRIRVHASSRVAMSVEDILPESRHADLLVWGTAPARGAFSLILGQPVQALLRQARRPVLVVRRMATGAYRKVLVAVDFSAASHRLVELGLALNKSADVELFHAISTANEGKLRYAEVSEQAIKAYRLECRRYAQDRLFWLTDSYDARRNRVQSAIGHGDAARQAVVQQQHGGAELIVVGKHPASLVTDLVFGSVAGRVLRHANTDVLVVPHDFVPASSACAATRLAQEQPAVRRVRAGAAAAT